MDIPGQASATSDDGFTVTSTTNTEAQIREAMGIDESGAALKDEPPTDGTPAGDGKPAAGEKKPDVSEAGRTLAGAKPSKHEKRQQEIQADIDALTKKKYDTKREADAAQAEYDGLIAKRDALRREIEEAAAKRPAAGAPPAAAAAAAADPNDPEPQEKDFDDWEKYTRALARWEGRQEARKEAQRLLTEERAKDQARQQAEAADREVHALIQSHAARMTAAKAAHPDFDEVISSVDDIPLNIAVNHYLAHSKDGGELAYALAQNREEYARINALPPLEARDEMVLFARDFTRRSAAPGDKGPAPAAPPISRAKPVTRPVTGSSSAPSGGAPENSSLDDFVHAENTREREARRIGR